MALEYLKKETRKLIAMILIVIATGMVLFKLNFWGILFLVGITLMLEHLIVYGRFDFLDFFGHEWMGLIFVLIPLIKFKLWLAIVLIVISFLLACRYKWHGKVSPIRYALSKLFFWKKWMA